MGWRRQVTRWRSSATRTLDHVLIAGVATGRFIFAVRCKRLWRRLRHWVVGVLVILFGVCLSDGGRGGA